MGEIVWREITRNCHQGRVDDTPIVTVVRHQRHRKDGTKHDWRIVVLGDHYTWDQTFCHHDPRDLGSTKSAAEARVRWAVGCLYRSLKTRAKRTAKAGTGGET